MSSDSFRKKSSHLGFTLLELLIVIAIMVVLALVALFGVGKYMDSARQSRAIKTMKQVNDASMAYSIEYNGDINVVRTETESLVERRSGVYGGVQINVPYVTDSFWGRIQPHLYPEIPYTTQAKMSADLKSRMLSLFTIKDTATFAGSFQQDTNIYHDGAGLPVPFAFNVKLAPWNKLVKISAVSNPAKTIYMTFGFFRIQPTSLATYYPRPPSGTVRPGSVDYFNDKSAAVMFLDGHIEILKPPVDEERLEIY
jgi:prepilin-type N-terminal cleavage/methylation domain-containing protein